MRQDTHNRLLQRPTKFATQFLFRCNPPILGEGKLSVHSFIDSHLAAEPSLHMCIGSRNCFFPMMFIDILKELLGGPIFGYTDLVQIAVLSNRYAGRTTQPGINHRTVLQSNPSQNTPPAQVCLRLNKDWEPMLLKQSVKIATITECINQHLENQWGEVFNCAIAGAPDSLAIYQSSKINSI